MYWHSTTDPFLRVDDRSTFFRCNAPTLCPTRVLRCHGRETTALTLENEACVEQWLNSEVFKADLLHPPAAGQDRSGYHIVLCGQPEPARNVNPKGIPRMLYNIPFTLATWQRLTRSFYLHDAIRSAMLRSNTSPTSTYLVKREGEEILEMYTAAMSRDWPEPQAISSTHFRHSKLTVAVVFGCTKEQMDKVEELLHYAPEVKSHPLLMIGVFAELYRDRVYRIVKDAVADCDIATMKLGLNGTTRPQVRRSFELSRELRNCRLKTKQAEEEVRSTQGQLHKMMQHIEEYAARRHGSAENSESGLPDNDITTSTMRFKHRFDEISIEFDAMMARCRMTFDDMTYSEELFTSELLSHDAESARNQAKASTVIAFVAMLYLPITTVATIFAMPVFNFENDWRDIRFRATDNETADAGGSTDSSKAQDGGSPKPVLSFYFWVYLIVSVSLTAVTVFGWWRYMRASHRRRKSKERRISYTGGFKHTVGGEIFFRPEYEGGKDAV